MKSAFCIICDDVRREDSGKLFYIGVYTGDIWVSSFPAVIPPLQLVLHIWQTRDEEIELSAEMIVSPPGGAEIRYPFDRMIDETTVAQILADPEVVNVTSRGFIKTPEMVVPEEGRLKIDVKIGALRLRAGSLRIRLVAPSPKTPPSP